MWREDITILDRYTLPELELALDIHTREMIPVDRFTAYSWSASRHQMFQRCRRQYYLNYYGSRRVREANNPLISAIWWLKQVVTLRAFVGQVIHHAAKKAVESHRDRTPLSREALLDLALDYYQTGIRASQRGARHEGNWNILFEHAYPDAPSSVERDLAESTVTDLINNLVDSEAYALITRWPADVILEVDPSFKSFTLTDVRPLDMVRIFAIPDVLLHNGQGITIIDWKTGDVQDPRNRFQAGIYRLYAHLAYGIPQEMIAVLFSALGNAGENVYPPGGMPSVTEADALMRDSIHQQVVLMEDIQCNTVSIRDFPLTDDLSLCQSCGFRRACWRHEVSDE